MGLGHGYGFVGGPGRTALAYGGGFDRRPPVGQGIWFYVWVGVVTMGHQFSPPAASVVPVVAAP